MSPPSHRCAGRRWRAGVAAALLALTAACGSSAPGAGADRVDARDWPAVLAQARGQTVSWFMYGGDQALNAFVTGYLAARLARDGVTLDQVRVTDTGDAVNKVLGQREAGRTSGGAVDAIWVNGENFATGAQARIWYCDWAGRLPNARYVDAKDPAVTTDFGTPVRGCESVWQRANSALVYDSRALSPADVTSVTSLLGWARAHPGRFTYPAPPDFTGSMAVRTLLYGELGGPGPLAGPFDESAYTRTAARLWLRLNALEPSLWRGGSTYPQTQTEVERLYGDGEISAFLTYGPGAVADQVAKGVFPPTTREAVLAPGNIANNSFLAIPADAAHRAGALVLANSLQDPVVQLALYKAAGVYPAIDVARTGPAVRRAFAAVPVAASVLPPTALTRTTQPELASAYITRLERDWVTSVLQR